jgi:hypothetical protein
MPQWTARWVSRSIFKRVTIRADSYNTGYNAFQIIEQCEKAVSKLTGYALVNENYRHKCEKGDFSRKRMVFLEVIIAPCCLKCTQSFYIFPAGVRAARAHWWLYRLWFIYSSEFGKSNNSKTFP